MSELDATLEALDGRTEEAATPLAAAAFTTVPGCEVPEMSGREGVGTSGGFDIEGAAGLVAEEREIDKDLSETGETSFEDDAETSEIG